ncbi:MAG: hypothetical protein EZS28_039576 [Streblomastix strix]|uniref:Uncharacterized protein n=1 Tax=Streblomastix strix TaxID=222440 RepID=A0A5J4U2U5_9EUKA|nr:MAG: hypothetical protein EZS28_039576 [Streblomastix strix]
MLFKKVITVIKKNQLVTKENDLLKIDIQLVIKKLDAVAIKELGAMKINIEFQLEMKILDIKEKKQLNLKEMKKLNLTEMKKFDFEVIKKSDAKAMTLDGLINIEFSLEITMLDVGVSLMMKMNVFIVGIMKDMQGMMENGVMTIEFQQVIVKLYAVVIKKLDVGADLMVKMISYEQY